MALSAANCLTEVRALLNESVAQFWSDAEINNWVSQATIMISSLGAVETTATVTLVASTIEYAVPTTYANPTVAGTQVIKIVSARYTDIGLTRVFTKHFGHLAADATSNTPLFWSHFGQRVYFYPVGSGASGTIDLTVQVESDAVADLPDAWQPLAITWATAKAKQKDRKYAEAAALMTEFKIMASFLRNDLLERPIDDMESMKLPNRTVRR